MKLYIWHRVGPVSLAHHPDGALLVYALSLEDARQLADNALAVVIKENGHDSIGPSWNDVEPNIIASVDQQPTGSAVIVHRDAGCC